VVALAIVMLGMVGDWSGGVTADAAVAVNPLKVVVVGDSYSAGNGARSYYGPTSCYRSHDNWAERYADWLVAHGPHAVTLVNRACSGAVTANFFGPRDLGTISQVGTECRPQSDDEQLTKIETIPGRPTRTRCHAVLRPQMEALGKDTDLVVFTFGGNDVNFGEIVQQCFIVGLRDPGNCREHVEAAERDLSNVQLQLVRILSKMREKLRDDAKVVLLGYPHLVGGEYGYVLKSHNLLHRVTDSYDAGAKVRAFAVRARSVQQAAVDEANAAATGPFVTYVDSVLDAFSGHEPDPRLFHPNPERWLNEGGDTRIKDEWYHPNTHGHDAYKELLQVHRDFGASHSPEAAGSLDLAFVIDTTGSMGGTIDAVKSHIDTIVDRLAAGTSSYRLAVASFRDHPEWTGDPNDYPGRVDQDFTADPAAVKAAVAALTAGGGGDGPESAYSGITSALNLHWRPGVKKQVIVFTDIDAHDPEPVSGLTAADVIIHSAVIDPAVINLVDTGSGSNLAEVARRTGGLALEAATPEAIDGALDSIVTTSLQAPYAWVGEQYLAAVGSPVTFDASGSFDPTGGSLRYEWDVDNDGTVDARTDVPQLPWTYTASYDGLVSVRVISSSGLSSVATAQVRADPDGDGILDPADNCPSVANLGQEDEDGDNVGNVCDDTPGFPTTDETGVTVEESINSQPTAAADEFSATGDQPLAVPAPGVLGNDLDADAGDILHAELTTPPAHGSLTLAADGSFTYNPNSGFAGDDTFEYRAVDDHGGASAPARVVLHVSAAKAGTQRLTFVAGGRHPLTVSGKVVDGEFHIRSSNGRITGISGTATVSDRKGKDWVVTITVKRRAHRYAATVEISGGRRTTVHSYAGTGVIAGNRKIVVGAFRGHGPRFGFTIQTKR
jgi:lysophospholipase L1-like esterase